VVCGPTCPQGHPGCPVVTLATIPCRMWGASVPRYDEVAASRTEPDIVQRSGVAGRRRRLPVLSWRAPHDGHRAHRCRAARVGRAECVRSPGTIGAAMSPRLERARQRGEPAADRRGGPLAEGVAVPGRLGHAHVASRVAAGQHERTGVPADPRATHPSSTRDRALAPRASQSVVVRRPAHDEPCSGSHEREGAPGRPCDEGLPALSRHGRGRRKRFS